MTDEPRGTARARVIGVAGGTGSGKTTIVGRLIGALGAAEVTCLEQDRYYRDLTDMPVDLRGERNFDHPEAFDLELLVGHLEALAAGHEVAAPRYDFHRHARERATDRLLPRSTIIVEGILVLAEPRLRALMDLCVFVDTDDDLRFIRRLQRDVAERGRTTESVIAQYLATVKPMHLEFVEPSKRYAHVIVPEGGHNDAAVDMLLKYAR